MPVSQQRLQSINFTKLKNLQNVSIDLSEGPLIAIMGVNGIGKSTVLHALACCYKPDLGRTISFQSFFCRIPLLNGMIATLQLLTHFEMVLKNT